jgi:hypothetical protein
LPLGAANVSVGSILLQKSAVTDGVIRSVHYERPALIRRA